MSRLLIISLCAVVFLAACSTETPDVTTEQEVDTIEVEDDSMEESEDDEDDIEVEADIETEADTEVMTDEEEVADAQSAQYVTYSDGAIAEYAGSDKVIFFHASWCPACRALDAELSSQISELPEGTVVMKADYDQETELREKYGVNLQHTLVFIDDEGNTTRSNLTGADFAKLQAEL